MDVRSALDQLAFILRAVADDIGDMMARDEVSRGELAVVLDQIGASARHLELVALRSTLPAPVGKAEQQELTGTGEHRERVRSSC